MRRFRFVWKFLVPGWLQTGEGELVQWVEGLLLDAFAERCHQSAYLMLPSVAPSDALDKIGSDRGIPRGFIEPEDSYRARLRRWRYPRGHRVRGNAPGLLEQISLAIHGTQYETVDARGTRYALVPPAAEATVERGVAWDWDSQTLLPNWGRFWIVVKSTGALWPSFDDGAWGDTWDAAEEACWAGASIHRGELMAIKMLVTLKPIRGMANTPSRCPWTPAGRRPIYLVLWFEGETYPEPDGTWNEWGNRPPQNHAFEPLHDSLT